MEQTEFIETYAIQRKHTNSLKWDALEERFGSADLLPLWVADADFSIDHQVKADLIARIQHGAFGYSLSPKEYVQTYQAWQNRHEGTQFQANWLTFSPGVVQSLTDLIACFTTKGDQIAIQPPVYYPFYHCIQDQGRVVVEAPLVNQNGNYRIDFEQLEQLFQTQAIRLFILCSPHNPVGRVWTKEELTHFFQLCQRYQVLVISDEIHSDLVVSSVKFVSAITVAQELGFTELIVCNSASKTFNLASLLSSHIWIPEATLAQQFTDWSKIHRQTELSVLGQVAAQSAYRHSDEWLAAFMAVVEANYEYVKQTLLEHFPTIEISPLEGTYLTWINLASVLNGQTVKTIVQDQAKLAIDFGEWFGKGCQTYIRINLATTPQVIEQAMHQLVTTLKENQ